MRAPLTCLYLKGLKKTEKQSQYFWPALLFNALVTTDNK